MKIYFLDRPGGGFLSEREMLACIVVANTPAQARLEAAKYAMAEGTDVWTDSCLTNCRLLGVPARGMLKGFVDCVLSDKKRE